MNTLGHICQELLGEEEGGAMEFEVGGGAFSPVKKAVLIHSIVYHYHITFRWFH